MLQGFPYAFCSFRLARMGRTVNAFFIGVSECLHVFGNVESRFIRITLVLDPYGRGARFTILGGIGVHAGAARQQVEALAERIGGLLVTTVKAKDLFRGNPWDLGILGSSSHSAARSLIETADCVISFGAAMNSLTMSSGIALNLSEMSPSTTSSPPSCASSHDRRTSVR